MNCIIVTLGYAVSSVALPPAGNVVVAGWSDSRVTVHRLTDGALIRELQSQPAAVWSLAFSPDGKYLAIGSDDNPNSPVGAVEIWRTSDWHLVAALPTDDIGGTRNLDWAAYDSGLVVGHADGVVRLWDPTNTCVVRIFDAMTCELPKVACAPHASLLAHGCDEIVQIVRLADGKILHEWGRHADWIHALAWSPTDPLVAVCAGDPVVWLWNAEQDTSAWQLELSSTCMSLAFSPDGQHLACGGSDGRIRIVRVADAVVETELVGHQGSVRAVKWAVDGQGIVSGGTDGTLRIWS